MVVEQVPKVTLALDESPGDGETEKPPLLGQAEAVFSKFDGRGDWIRTSGHLNPTQS